MTINFGTITDAIEFIAMIFAMIRHVMRKLSSGNLTMGAKLRERWSSDKLLLILISVGILSGGFSLYLRYAEPSWQIITTVYKPFKSAYASHKEQLGKAITDVSEPDNVAEHIHKNGTVIWIGSKAPFYLLKHTDKTWNTYPEMSAVSSTKDPNHPDYKWRSRSKLEELFNNSKPPYGGVAKAWYNDPQKWEWLGPADQQRYCHEVRYQEFENGLIIGNFGNSIGRSLMIILIEDGQGHKNWYQMEAMNQPAPICNSVSWKE